MVKYSGSCQCGAVRYETGSAPAFAFHCQCLDCRKSSGAGHATWAAFAVEHVRFSGVRSGHASTADRGGTVTREFCPACGGRLSLRPSDQPGTVLIAAGTLDDPGSIRPTLAQYNRNRVAWDHLDAGLAVYLANPPRTLDDWARESRSVTSHPDGGP